MSEQRYLTVAEEMELKKLQHNFIGVLKTSISHAMAVSRDGTVQINVKELSSFITAAFLLGKHSK